MPSMAQDSYLFTEVNTATPQKLQLLLIEGALRLANRARQFRQEGCDDRALQALLEAQAMVSQILVGLDPEVGGDLATRISALYEFIFRSLVNAGYRRDEKGLGDAIRILEIERETWRQVCDKVAADAPRRTWNDAERDVPPPFSSDVDLFSQPGGFSLEA